VASRSTPAIFCLLASMGCNRYELFNLAGYEQASFSNEADILFVIDNSPSMSEETADLALNFNVFIETLTSAEGATPETENLSDAVSNYMVYTQERGKYLDYQLAITTTSVDFTGGDTVGIDPGEAGTLLGDPTVVDKLDPEVNATFQKNLLCEATYWDANELTDDPDYVCGDPVGEAISPQYLDCVCGADWAGRSGSGDEEPLEAALMALCRASAEPPEACFEATSPFEGSQELTNDGFLREEGTVVVVVVTDEGDNSRRLAQGEEDIAVYLDPFTEFGKPVKVVVVGPAYDPETEVVDCVSTAVPGWSANRLLTASETTGGFYKPIVEEVAEDVCEATDFAQHLRDLGALLQNLTTAFQLQSVPDVSTIRVWVDEEEIPKSSATLSEEDPEAEPVYGDGWSYDSAQNAVVFWGKYIPDYNADVRIYYRPLDGNPRELPF
jgi:hypothetical protein